MDDNQHVGLDHQEELWNDYSDMTRIALVAPFGQGKTRALVLDDFFKHCYNFKHTGMGFHSMLVSPTYGLVEDVMLPLYEEVIASELGIAIQLHGASGRPEIRWPPEVGNAVTMLRSAEIPKRLAGTNLSYVGFDEPGLIKHEAYKKGAIRARHPKAKCRRVALAGTPEGLGWFSELFDLDSGWKKQNGRNVWRGEIKIRGDIKHKTIRGNCWHKDMAHQPGVTRASFEGNEAEIDSYLNGLFVPMYVGRCYRGFDPAKHKTDDAVYDPALPLILTCDFNIDHMRWLIMQVDRAAGQIRFIDEIQGGHNEDVTACAKEMVHRWRSAERSGVCPLCQSNHPGDVGEHKGELHVTGDFSGQARNAATGTTAFTELFKVLRGNHWSNVALRLEKKGNPRQEERVRAVGFHLGGAGYQVFIHPRCSEFLLDLAQNHWADTIGTPRVAKSNEPPENLRTHAGDAGGYGIWHFARPSALGTSAIHVSSGAMATAFSSHRPSLRSVEL